MIGSNQINKFLPSFSGFMNISLAYDRHTAKPFPASRTSCTPLGGLSESFHPIRRAQPGDVAAYPNNNIKCDFEMGITDLRHGRAEELLGLRLRSCKSLALARAPNSFLLSGQ